MATIDGFLTPNPLTPEQQASLDAYNAQLSSSAPISSTTSTTTPLTSSTPAVALQTSTYYWPGSDVEMIMDWNVGSPNFGKSYYPTLDAQLQATMPFYIPPVATSDSVPLTDMTNLSARIQDLNTPDVSQAQSPQIDISQIPSQVSTAQGVSPITPTQNMTPYLIGGGLLLLLLRK